MLTTPSGAGFKSQWNDAFTPLLLYAFLLYIVDNLPFTCLCCDHYMFLLMHER